MSELQRTKKKHKNKLINKKLLWEKFDLEIKNKDDIECIYKSPAQDQLEICDTCKNKLFINEEGFPVCENKKCGIIKTNITDTAPEWRYYGEGDQNSSDPTRCGMPINPLLQESSFGCKVLVSWNTSYEMRKIRRYTDWIGMPYKEKSRYDEFQKICMLGGQSGIPKLILDDAMRYHKKVSEARTFRGSNRDGIIAASVYISSRINNFPRTAKEIAQIFHLETGAATKGCKNAIGIINELESNNLNTDKTLFSQTTPDIFIERYCSKLNINNELTKVCKFVSIRIIKFNLIPENTPPSIAAGIVYYISQCCNLNISKKDVSNVSEISEVTINKCYKKLIEKTKELIPERIIEKYKSSIENN